MDWQLQTAKNRLLALIDASEETGGGDAGIVNEGTAHLASEGEIKSELGHS